MENNRNENVLAGVFGAILFALAGGILWVIIYQLGYLAAISGLVGVFCAIKGYALFAKKESVKGVVIAIIATLIVMVVAWYASLVVMNYREYEGALTIAESFSLTKFAFKEIPEYRSGAIEDLVKGILFTVAGGVAFAVSSIKRIKAENAYNAKMAQQNEPVFNGEPEYRYDDTDTNN